MILMTLRKILTRKAKNKRSSSRENQKMSCSMVDYRCVNTYSITPIIDIIL